MGSRSCVLSLELIPLLKCSSKTVHGICSVPPHSLTIRVGLANTLRKTFLLDFLSLSPSSRLLTSARWKLSTRGRKKSLEDALKTSDYSDHHLIPVYGFRCTDDCGGTDIEQRRLELHRLEARALAAERTALERRARAEGGAGGAAFARAMSRRALARAEWIQKVTFRTDANMLKRAPGKKTG